MSKKDLARGIAIVMSVRGTASVIMTMMRRRKRRRRRSKKSARTGDLMTNVLNNAEEKPPVTAEPTSTTPSAALEPSTRGRKRDREGKPVVEPAVSSTAKPEIDDPTQDDGELSLRTATARERGGRGHSSLRSGTSKAVIVFDKQVPMNTSIRFFNANNERN